MFVALIGLVWTLQGLGSEYAPQSFMTNSRLWVIIGVVTMIGGGWLVRRSWLHRG
jgi:hypothetical protein